MKDTYDIHSSQVEVWGNILLVEFIKSEQGFPELPLACISALRECNFEVFSSELKLSGYSDDLPINRARALTYALYHWYLNVYN